MLHSPGSNPSGRGIFPVRLGFCQGLHGQNVLDGAEAAGDGGFDFLVVGVEVVHHDAVGQRPRVKRLLQSNLITGNETIQFA